MPTLNRGNIIMISTCHSMRVGDIIALDNVRYEIMEIVEPYKYKIKRWRKNASNK